MKNNCNVNDTYAVGTYVTMIIVILAIYALIFVQRKRIISFDEKQFTAEDYTIEIKVSISLLFLSFYDKVE